MIYEHRFIDAAQSTHVWPVWSGEVEWEGSYYIVSFIVAHCLNCLRIFRYLKNIMIKVNTLVTLKGFICCFVVDLLFHVPGGILPKQITRLIHSSSLKCTVPFQQWNFSCLLFPKRDATVRCKHAKRYDSYSGTRNNSYTTKTLNIVCYGAFTASTVKSRHQELSKYKKMDSQKSQS